MCLLRSTFEGEFQHFQWLCWIPCATDRGPFSSPGMSFQRWDNKLVICLLSAVHNNTEIILKFYYSNFRMSGEGSQYKPLISAGTYDTHVIRWISFIKPYFHEQACLWAGCSKKWGEVNIREHSTNVTWLSLTPHYPYAHLIAVPNFFVLHIKPIIKH